MFMRVRDLRVNGTRALASIARIPPRQPLLVGSPPCQVTGIVLHCSRGGHCLNRSPRNGRGIVRGSPADGQSGAEESLVAEQQALTIEEREMVANAEEPQ